MNRVFSILVVLLCLAGLVAAQQSRPMAPAPAPAPEAQGAWAKSIPLKGEDTLTVYIDPGNVILSPADTKELTIKIQGLPKEELGRVQLTSKDKDIKLDFRGDKTTIGTFLIQLPASFNLDIFTSGNLDVQGALSGKIRARATTGDVNIGDVTGTLTVDSTGSDVTVGNITGSANLSTNGDLDVQSVTGDLDMKNRSGDSYAKNIGGNLNARAEDGDVSIGEVSGNATVIAGIGDVDLRKVGGVATLNTDGGDIDLFEVPSMVVASSNSGEITLRKVTGAVDAKTEDGDITAEMYSGAGGSSKFYTRDGDISVYFPATAKATVGAKFHAEAAAAGTTPADAKEAAEDVITSDWPVANAQKQGGDVVNKYEINGGGDSVMLESVNGELLIKKLTPKPEPKPATQTQN